MKTKLFAILAVLTGIFLFSCNDHNGSYGAHQQFPEGGNGCYESYGDHQEGGSDLYYTFKETSDNVLTIESRGGSATIAKAKKTFTSSIDPRFRSRGFNKLSQATKEINVKVYALMNRRTFIKAYGELSKNLNKNLDELCLSQSQIIYFCKSYPAKMRPERYGRYGTFFLFKENGEYFVAKIVKDADGFNASVLNYYDPKVSYEEYHYLFVVPVS